MGRNTKLIDSVTGEIISDTLETTRMVKADEFMQVYLEDLSAIMSLTKPSEITVLVVLWKDSTYFDAKAGYPGNKVVVNKQLIHTVIEESTRKGSPLTEGTIRNVLSALVKKRVLIKDDVYRGIYYLNPEFFFKGKLADRKATVSFTRTYKISPSND